MMPCNGSRRHRWKARVLWEPRDLWVGVYWDRTTEIGNARWAPILKLYVCILPCLPILLTRTSAAASPG